MKTKVIFRLWRGDVIALFPELAATMNPTHCESYQHIGQHSAADPYIIIRESAPATEEQYLPLWRELTANYEYDLEVIHTHEREHYEARVRDINGGQGL